MPRRDGTGPIGAGSMNGRGLGVCSGDRTVEQGAGFGRGLRCGYGRGFGRGFSAIQADSRSQKEQLRDRKIMLQKRLEVINKQLEIL